MKEKGDVMGREGWERRGRATYKARPGNRRQSRSSADVEDGSGAATVQVPEAVAVRRRDGVAEDGAAGRGGGGEELDVAAEEGGAPALEVD